jgi:RNA polymerase sigma-70 factor (ECF subfamily)
VGLAHLGKVASPEAVSGPDPTRLALEAGLRLLPDQQRRALVLRYMCDLTVAEIAALEGAREGTIKSRLARGREAMAQVMGESEPHEAHAGQRGET